MNLWFRVRVEERGVEADKQSLLEDLRRRKTLEHKLRNWPERYLSASLDQTAGAGAQFAELKDLRNSIVHFTSTHESLEAEGFAIHGLADTSQYDALNSASAQWSLETAEATVREIFRLAGQSESEIQGALHAWTGRVAV